MAFTSTISINNDGIIHIRVVGNISSKHVQFLQRRFEKFAKQLRDQNKRVLILIDLSKLDNIDSGARLATRKSLLTQYDRCAIYGGQNEVGSLIMYLIRAAGTITRTRYFKNEAAAKSWLFQDDNAPNKNPLTRLVVILVLLLTLVKIAAWLIFAGIFKRFVNNIAHMPIEQNISILLLCYLLFSTMVPRTKRRQRADIVIVLIIYLINLLGLASSLFHINFSAFCTLLAGRPSMFKNATVAGSTMVALNLLWLSGGIFILHNIKARYLRVLGQTMLVLSATSIVLTFLGFIFKIKIAPSHTQWSPFAITLFLLLLVGVAARYSEVVLNRLAPRFDRIWSAGICVFLVLFSISGVLYRLASDRLAADRKSANAQELRIVSATIRQSVTGYEKTLFGFRALFDASDLVTAQDFKNYFDSIRSSSQQPSPDGIIYIARVLPTQREKFVQTMRSQQTFDPVYKNFMIRSNNTISSTVYVISYIQPSSNNTLLGIGLSGSTEQMSALHKASNQNEPIFSNSIDNLSQDRDQKTANSFMVSIPVYSNTNPVSVKQRQQTLLGFIGASLDYNTLLNEIVKDHLANGVKVVVTDEGTGETIYSSSPPAPINTAIKSEETIIQPGQNWVVSVSTPTNFDISTSARSLPLFLLLGGTLISLLGGGFFTVLARSRQRAIVLADSITEDLRQERNIAIATQREYNTMLSSIGEGVMIIDNTDKIILFNPAAVRKTGIQAHLAVGRPYHEVLEFVDERTNKINESFIKHALGGRQQKISEHQIYVYNPHRRARVFVSSTASPIRDNAGNIRGAAVVFRNMSEERKLQKAKDEFVSLASHQLRTPATGVKQYVGLMLEGYSGQLTKEQQHTLEMAYESNERQLQIITDLLGVARIDAGKVVLDKEIVDLPKLVGDVIHEQLLSIKDRKQDIVFNPPDSQVTILADSSRLRMVFENLLSNASKYSPDHTTIHIEIRDRRSTVQICFQDQGIGIKKEELNNLFQKFSRLNNSQLSNMNGTGLGLYWAKSIIDLHGGSIAVESEPNKGSTFIITLPRQSGEQ